MLGLSEAAMTDNRDSKGSFGIILGAVVAIAAVIFLLSGGEYFGKKTVEGDKDLPPVAKGLPGPPPETTGGPEPPRRIVVPPATR
jgi:hypothetical protein